jgi:hypothetical protein
MHQAAEKKARKTVNKRSSTARRVTLSKKSAAGQLASIIETHMQETGLSESEKKRRVAQFSDRVDAAIERHAKS